MIRYLLVMSISAAIAFAKIIALAGILEPSAFGSFVAIYGAGIFLSTFVSFGAVEGTIKEFSILFGDNSGDREKNRIAKSFRFVLRTLLYRYVILFVFIALAVVFFIKDYSLFDALGLALFSASSSVATLFASVIRASHSLPQQKLFYFFKSICSFILAVILAIYFGWRGALWGEVIGGIIFLFISFAICRSLGIAIFLPSKDADTAPLYERKGKDGGGKLYLAFQLSSAFSQLDRVFIKGFLGAVSAGTYGVAAIIFQATSLSVNMVTQRVGTRFIRLNASGTPISRQIFELFIWGALFSLLSCFLVVIIFLFKDIHWVAKYIVDYQISDRILVYSGLISAVQIFSMLDFFLIAHHKELAVLVSSTCAFVTFLTLFCIGYVLDLSLEWFFLFVFIGRFVQVSIQVLYILLIRLRHL